MSTEAPPARSERPGVWGRLEDAARSRPVPEGDGLWSRLSHLVDPAEVRPKLADDVEVKEFKLRWGNDYWMIANHRDHIFYKLDPSEAKLLELMDGTRTVKEIVLERFKDSGDLELSGVSDLVYSLYVGNMLDRRYVDLDEAMKRAMDPVAQKRSRQFMRTLDIDWRGAGAFVRWMYDHGLKWLFKPPAIILLGLWSLFGVALFFLNSHSGHFNLSGSSLAIGALILIFLEYFRIAVHELGHALVLHHYGRKVHSAGFMIYFGAPAFYIESSDGLMLDRKQRMQQFAAGVYLQATLSAVAGIVAYLYPGWVLSETLYRFSVLNYFSIMLNLTPMLELDGYYILADAIQVPDLRPRSIEFVRHHLVRKLRHREPWTAREVGLALFGVFGFFMTIFAFWLAYFFWKTIFGGLVTRLWDSGIVGRALLVALAAFVAGPAVRGGINVVRSLSRRIRAISRQIKFRLETKWRVEAAKLIDGLPTFEGVPGEVLGQLAGRVSLRSFSAGQPVVRQGERPDAFYVVRTGTFEVVEENKETGSERVLRVLGRGEGFGELGLAQSAPRAATVRAAEQGEVFEVDKGTFDELLKDSVKVPTFAPTAQVLSELRELPSFAYLEPDQLAEVMDNGEWVNIGPGETILAQGDIGDAFYAIRSGQVEVVKDDEVVATLGQGDYFGEVALLLDVPRTATVRTRTPVRVFRLRRRGFDRLVAESFKKGHLNPHLVQSGLDRH
ncbi:MAG: cyclic nucleotide-binding domain-containing protein [Actinomycetota bacterium]